jgi:hypothetical protein
MQPFVGILDYQIDMKVKVIEAHQPMSLAIGKLLQGLLSFNHILLRNVGKTDFFCYATK